MAPLKTVPFIAGVLTGISMIFYILAASSNKYLQGTPDLVQANVQTNPSLPNYAGLFNVHLGAFFWCYYQYPVFNSSGLPVQTGSALSGSAVELQDTCFRIDSFCQLGGAVNPTPYISALNPNGVNYTYPVGAPPLSAFDTSAYGANANFDSCPKFNAFRAFLMLGLVFSVLSSTWQLVLYTVAADKQLAYINRWGLIFGLLSGVTGIISMAIFVAKFKSDGWNYGWSFGLALAAWTLIFISAPLFYFTAKPAANKA
jgi:hypothetical protein